MKPKYLLPGALLAASAFFMPFTPARADVVLADTVGFITGTQIFTDSFDLSTPGVLTVTLSAIPWLDTLQDLNCFLTSPSGGLIGPSSNGTSLTQQVQAGDVSVNWYGVAAGTYGTGAYGLEVTFAPTGSGAAVSGAAGPGSACPSSGSGLVRRARRGGFGARTHR